jgi:GDPmannose 4,6-dehydratase
MGKKVALITGCSGQDGSLLSDLLLNKGYHVIGTTRRSFENTDLDTHHIEWLQLQLDNRSDIIDVIKSKQPDELYLLGARASSQDLLTEPVQTASINGMSITYFLEAVKSYSPNTRVCFASSSEVFAGSKTSPQNESTPVSPVNFYGAAKAFAGHMTTLYRMRYNLHASTAILFNHESHLRPLNYVTRKITHGAASIKLGLSRELMLGDIDAQRDWMHASDAVQGMWLALQHSHGDDYVFGTGRLHSVKDVCDIAFSHLSLNCAVYVKTKQDANRRIQNLKLVADSTHAITTLGWKPKVSLVQMIQQMVDYDFLLLQQSRINEDIQ